MARAYLDKDWDNARRDSAKLATPPDKTHTLNLSKRPRILTAEARNALYSEALLSAAHRCVWASSLASWRQFSKWAQFIWQINNGKRFKKKSLNKLAYHEITIAVIQLIIPDRLIFYVSLHTRFAMETVMWRLISESLFIFFSTNFLISFLIYVLKYAQN